MKQAALDLNLSLKRTRKREFLEQMERVVPWAALVTLIAPYYPEGRTGRPPSGAVKVVAAKSSMLKRLVFLFDSDPLVFAG